MSHSNAAVRAASNNSSDEVRMALISSIVRAPAADVSEIFIKRDGAPDLVIERGQLILTIETKPRGQTPISPNKRWKVYRLYKTHLSSYARTGRHDKLVVAEEGHSSMEGESIRYKATICEDPIGAWKALGSFDELKAPLLEVGLSIVQKI